ncbi:hypothetical protein HMSSN036_57680 [Paenibacillus macerans]|nr:hypothetical protein HMSSN036_57680 [Paenibacillus macerans]
MLAINIEVMPKIKLMGFVSYPNPWIHFKRTINEHILYFIKSGELHIRENGVPYILKKGMCSSLNRTWSTRGSKNTPATIITFI